MTISDRPSSLSSGTSSAPRASARALEMNGSEAINFMPNAVARSATAPPMRPSPTMPSVLPYNSVPMNGLRSQRPARIEATASGVWRASDNISAKVCSVAASVFAPGVLSTTMPASVAAGTSIASTPTPARATTVSFGPYASSARSTRVSERTIKPSASASAACSASAERPTVETTSMPASRKTPIPVSENGSATTTRAERLGALTALMGRTCAASHTCGFTFGCRSIRWTARAL